MESNQINDLLSCLGSSHCADKTKKESIVNIVGSRTRTLLVAYMLLALGFMGLTGVSVEAGNMRSILLLACAITCGYVYQCPPFRLSYQGLGEPLCFTAFGPFATTAFYLLQSSTSKLPITCTILSASLLVGFTTSLILLCNINDVQLRLKEIELSEKCLLSLDLAQKQAQRW